MIISFADKDTETLFNDEFVKAFQSIERPARRKLHLINAAASIDDLRVQPGNKLETLRGDRAGQHSIRVNDQWRSCFVWNDGGAENVEIVDYH